MAATHELPLWELILRSALPSPTSAVYCVIGGMLITMLHFASLSAQGAFLPQLFEGEWARFYADNIMQPFLDITHNQAASTLIVAALWGALGLLIYTIGAGLAGGLRGFRAARHNIQMVDERHYLTHPLQNSFIILIAWRFGVGMLMAAALFLVAPMAGAALANDESVYVASNLSWRLLADVGLSAGIWAAVLHIYLFLLRLYLLRTRIFGEILY